MRELKGASEKAFLRTDRKFLESSNLTLKTTTIIIPKKNKKKTVASQLLKIQLFAKVDTGLPTFN